MAGLASTPVSTVQHLHGFDFQPVAAMGSWEIWFIPTPDLGVSEARRHQLSRAVEAVATFATGTQGLHHELFVHVWKLAEGDIADQYRARIKVWRPESGLGVWPDRKPPGVWTQESFMDASADVLTGEEPEMPSYRVIRITGPEQERISYARGLVGHNATTQVFSRLQAADWLKRTRDVFLPTVTEPMFQRSAFYLPLLEKKAVLHATPDLLDTWTGGADLYLRESGEDNGVLLLCRFPLAPLFKHGSDPAQQR